MEVKIKLVHTKKERENILKIRKNVFIDEQNIPTEIEIDAFEESANYIIAYIDEVPVGTARWREVDNDIKLERFAVLKNYRKKGIGKQLTEFIIDKTHKDKIIFLNSQKSAIGFYQKVGFETVGPFFEEANKLHQRMIFSRNSAMKP
ncbi:MAG: GNAT family N-acetyltransferase [Candidatus Neomarinimicrobiota bacterium]|nr:GNAT family N-acetyltransferase [Candidatus Neomarinimicrobiota bacterium]